MRTFLAALLIALAPTALAAGDTVYMRDGKEYEGTATREGDKVVVKTSMGAFEVDASDVLYISRDQPASEPASGPSEVPAEPADEPSAPAGTLFTAARATQPESVTFMLMRTLEGTPPGTRSYQLRRQLDRWRVFSHDRKRQIASTWYKPEDFIRRRRNYVALLKEAQDLFKKVPSSTRLSADKQAEAKKLQADAREKLKLAARTWLDPNIRRFLMGVAEHQAGNYRQAEAILRRCRAECPRVGAFVQAHGMALLKVNRPLDALEAYVALLRMHPDSRDALKLVNDAMTDVPGASTRRGVFLEAQDMIKHYDDPTGGQTSYATTRLIWLMPGKSWYQRDEVLPVPLYDRMVFRQAVGVPVAEQVLLADGSVVEDALELFVRIDADTIVPAVVRRVSRYGASRSAKGLALVTVADCRFTPVKTDGAAVPAKDGKVTVFGLNVFEEMGSDIRRAPAKVVTVEADGQAKLSAGLAPGEAAGAVVSEEGMLVGFLAGKTDVKADTGGEDRHIPPAEFASLLKQAARVAAGSGYGYGRARRTITPRQVEGQAFVIYAVAGEEFKED